MNFIANPQTIEECLNNVEFQLSNVRGFLSINSLPSAEVKAECLLRAVDVLIAKLKESQSNG